MMIIDLDDVAGGDDADYQTIFNRPLLSSLLVIFSLLHTYSDIIKCVVSRI
jgi:hypothetical protein